MSLDEFSNVDITVYIILEILNISSIVFAVLQDNLKLWEECTKCIIIYSENIIMNYQKFFKTIKKNSEGLNTNDKFEYYFDFISRGAEKVEENDESFLNLSYGKNQRYRSP